MTNASRNAVRHVGDASRSKLLQDTSIITNKTAFRYIHVGFIKSRDRFSYLLQSNVPRSGAAALVVVT